MTPAARLQATIEILDLILASVRDDGPPADAIVANYFKTRRYAGSQDRRAVRELVFSAVRRSAERPVSGRAAVLGLVRDQPALGELFGQPRGPQLGAANEHWSEAGVVPAWLNSELSPILDETELLPLLERAPLDLRVNVARSMREQVLASYEDARTTPLSPWGVRLPVGTRIDDSEAFKAGLVEVQDEGSQLVALACQPRQDFCFVDLCAGAGGKSLAVAAAAPSARIIATDINRSRLAHLTPRARRAGAMIQTRLLDPGRELDQLGDLHQAADLVLVDAPCSGSGTWRRNPEARWRLTPERLNRLVGSQHNLLRIGAELVKPNGRLVYAVCSVLSREGSRQVASFLEDRSSWIREEPLMVGGRPDGLGLLLTPGHDRTDGFFIARLRRPC